MNSAREDIFWEEIETYDRRRIIDFVDKAVSTLNIRFHATDRILVKPNLLQAPKQQNDPVVTHPDVIRCTLEYLRDITPNVYIGDSPSMGSLHRLLEAMGLLEDLKRLGIGISPFVRPVQVQGFPRFFTVDRTAFEMDVVVNLPKLKVHYQTVFTGALKNLFGFVQGRRKALLHFLLADATTLIECLERLSRELPISLCVLDAVEMMNGNGPTQGHVFKSKMLVGAKKCQAMDALICRMLGVDVERSCYRSVLSDSISSLSPLNIPRVGADIPEQKALGLPFKSTLKNSIKHYWSVLKDRYRCR